MKNLELLIDEIVAKCHREEGQILAGVQDLDVTFNTTKCSFEEIRKTMMLVCVARDRAAADQAAQNIAVWMVEHEDKRAKLHGQELLNWLLDARPNPPATLLYNTAVQKLSRGTQSDAREANQLLEKVLAQQTDPMLRGMALNLLAESLRLGRGIAQDQALSIRYCYEAANLGNAEAAYNTGVYFEGKSEECIDPYPMDMEQAAHYYEIAAQAHVLKAQTNLGILHLFKVLEKHDQGYGRNLLKMAAAEGDAAASDAIRRYDELSLREDQLAAELTENPANFEQERQRLEAAMVINKQLLANGC